MNDILFLDNLTPEEQSLFRRIIEELPSMRRSMDQQICLQRSLNIPLDDPRVLRIAEIHDKGIEASEEEKEERLGLILLLKKELPSK